MRTQEFVSLLRMCLTEKAFECVAQREMLEMYRSICSAAGSAATAAAAFARKCRGLNITPALARDRGGHAAPASSPHRRVSRMLDLEDVTAASDDDKAEEADA
jgi:hypothetical protein